MQYRIVCPSCSSSLTVSPEYLGLSISCPSCGEQLDIVRPSSFQPMWFLGQLWQGIAGGIARRVGTLWQRIAGTTAQNADTLKVLGCGGVIVAALVCLCGGGWWVMFGGPTPPEVKDAPLAHEEHARHRRERSAMLVQTFQEDGLIYSIDRAGHMVRVNEAYWDRLPVDWKQKIVTGLAEYLSDSDDGYVYVRGNRNDTEFAKRSVFGGVTIYR